MKRISITVNGEKYDEHVPHRMLLVDFLRDQLGLTGTHVGCTHEGVCGACTVHLNGEAIKSCLMLAVQADEHSVTTIEGLAEENLTPLQQSFSEEHGLQCGFCTPGILMNMTEFLKNHPDPTETEIREARDWQHITITCLCFSTAPSYLLIIAHGGRFSTRLASQQGASS